jgi:hypothetical protein
VLNLGEDIFQEEEHEHGDDEDGGAVPTVEHVPTTSMMIENGPSPSLTMTKLDQGETVVEGGIIMARTSKKSTCGSPSFDNHWQHE